MVVRPPKADPTFSEASREERPGPGLPEPCGSPGLVGEVPGSGCDGLGCSPCGQRVAGGRAAIVYNLRPAPASLPDPGFRRPGNAEVPRRGFTSGLKVAS